ncbi:hypothetical protein MSG28_005270 [Choristoneura fumiferana]|uniref:Uncharacterized protein n=1 Tax=Choristoneura fumiferana TaxID=7141 RepID=A0ACC0JQM5_CHOFU|nr:hypothetical protein MSG28_005270 [Choristoneura fumiferana]
MAIHNYNQIYLAAALPAPSASPRFVQVPAGDDEVVTVDLEAEPDYKFLNDVARNPRNAYILFTRRNPHNGQTLILNDANSIRNSNFNPAHTTIAIAHGYIQSQNSNLNQIIRDAYLNRMEANVIVLDWSRISQMDYMTAIYAIPSVGQGLGNLLNFISTVTGAPLTNMHVTGFSLGSHVAGNAGRTIRGLARVTGLDPYSPVWNLNSNRLAASDAVYVEAIHTSGNTGNRLFADVDYFVNGGDNQPGCWTSICSHNRSWEVFAATVTFNHLHGNQCTNVAEMRNNQCRGSQLPLGNSDVNKRGSGIFRVNTVLPPTTLALTSTASSTTTFNISTSTYATAIPPIPPSDRDRFLTFAESGHHRTFMFAKDNTFIQLDGDIIQRFQLRLCREISFKFRTRLPHGLLVYHNVKNPVFKMQPYALYVIVEKGELKVVHVFGKHLTSVTVGRALNRDQWHSVQVTIDVHGARLIAKVDQMKEEVYLKGLSFDTNYGITDNLTSVILIGGNLKYVYYNDVSILYELKQNNPKVHYIGALDPEFEETDIEVIPITYPFATSHIWWPVNKTNSFHLIFEFKTSKNMAVLAYSETNTVSGQGYWEVRMVKEEIRFELVSDVGKNVTVLKSVKFDPNNDWHTVELEYTKGRFKLTVDNHNKPAQMFGYIGQNCHFATFRKTCEELALLGYTRNDVYLIDIDGNGKFPPAHVKEFTAEMLQELISHSLFCRQYIKYDCNMAPLELHSATWFVSSSSDTVDYLGDVKRGYCSCGINATCANPTQTCNCDANENKWHADEGTFVIPKSLGITEMFFLQQKDLTEEAQGRITLGPLECVETNTQRYVVTFTTSQSYIEVPGWRKGDIAFSFRTTGTSAILLFQPPIRPNYPSFMVALTSEHELTFNFTLNTGTTRKLVINSKRKLNGGEWHKIWIDYNFYHI